MMYAVIKGGGGGLCPKIQRGGLCPSCKIQRGGGLCPSCKIHGGDFVHVYKNEQWGFCPGGIMSVSRKNPIAFVQDYCKIGILR